MSVKLHSITKKIIELACALHTKALSSHRRTLHAKVRAIHTVLHALQVAKVRAVQDLLAAEHAASKLDDEIHSGMTVYIDLAKK